jgi:hypothetical protein
MPPKAKVVCSNHAGRASDFNDLSRGAEKHGFRGEFRIGSAVAFGWGWRVLRVTAAMLAGYKPKDTSTVFLDVQVGSRSRAGKWSRGVLPGARRFSR